MIVYIVRQQAFLLVINKYRFKIFYSFLGNAQKEVVFSMKKP